MGKLGGITLFWMIAVIFLFDTWLGRILYCIYVRLCLRLFSELMVCIIILISNLLVPFYVMARSVTKTRR